jgi:broad specificity phosphatase PhoE
MYQITLLRHGESEGNLQGLIQGQADFPLTEAGKDQASRLASYWKAQGVKFDRIICSPLERALQTAEIIAKALGTPIDLEPFWMERNFGHLQGKKLDELHHQSPPIDFFDPFNPVGGTGESQVDLYTRACLAIQKLLKSPAGNYLIVSHGGILNKALFVILGITPQSHYQSPIFHFGNTGYAQFRYNSTYRQWAILSLNQLAHLQFEGINNWTID